MKITQQWVASEAAKAGIRHQSREDVREFNAKASPEANSLLRLATNVRRLGPDGECQRSGSLCLFGGTGQCGAKWSAWAGGWYPTAAVVKLGRRGKPRLVAVKMDWY